MIFLISFGLVFFISVLINFLFPGMTVPDKPLPNLLQWQGETEETFLKRVDEATQCLINEV